MQLPAMPMGGAGGARAAGRRAGRGGGFPASSDAKRKAINEKKRAEERRIHELFEKHDTNDSEALHDAQLKAFIQEYVELLPGMGEKHVSDAEVQYVMAIADVEGDGQVEKEDMLEAIATWGSLLDDQSLIAARFEQYDTDSSGHLDETQIAAVLKDLNGGAEVTAEEAKWVMEQADGKGPRQLEDGVINLEELKVAVAVWYCRASAEQKIEEAAPCCCTVM